MTETLHEDRPTPEQINNDDEFDKWAEAYERRMAQKAAKHTSTRR